MLVKCAYCKKDENVSASRAKSYKFCSYECRGKWRKQSYIGENNPNWKGGVKDRSCLHCGKVFQPPIPSSKQKFCSKPCADAGGFRYTGKDHPNYREEARRKNRGGSHKKWVNAVISRDKATCQHCHITGVELHAHHIKSYKDNTELRFDVDNGITLCYKCHWNLHSAINAKAVNSGKTLTGNAEDNPEPSLEGNLKEGVTTRGRAYRRWEGKCDYCDAFISRCLSDVTGKKHIFCDHICRGKWQTENSKITLTCIGCGKEFVRRRGDNASKVRPYCTHKCYTIFKAVTPPRAPLAKAMI